jgi:hypothetical protein
MEPKTLQMSDQKRLDMPKRRTRAIDKGKSPLTEDERAAILESAKELDVSGESKMQEELNYIAMEGTDYPVVVMTAISSCLRQLREDVDHYCKERVEEAVVGEPKKIGTLSSWST